MMLGLLAASLAAVLAAAPSRCVIILGTNDVHGHLKPRTVKDGAGAHEVGGLARFGTMVQEIRSGKEPVLLLDSGDLFQGTLESNVQHGRAVIAAYNLLGYDASTLGNHDFDFGREPPDESLQAAIKARLREAHFPFLAANVIDSKTGELPRWKNLAASKIFDLDGFKVGVIGVANPDTPSLTIRKYVDGLIFLNPVEPVVREAESLRAQGAQLIVVIAHVGGDCDLKNPDVATSCRRPNQIFDLLDALPAGTVDVVLGGHTHRMMAHWVDGVATLEAGAEGRYFSEIEACARPEGGLDRARTRLEPPHEIVASMPDKKLAAVLQPYLDEVAADAQRPLGPVLRASLKRDYHSLSPLGAMVAEAVRVDEGAQMAVVNAGGLRADLRAGPLTYGALYEMFPFENYVVVLDVTGREATAFINALGGSGHGYPQTAGMALRGWPGAYELIDASGVPLDPNKHYQLATFDFLLHGGDGTQAVVQKLSPAQVTRVGANVRDVIAEYLKAL
jgi:5'-nucleotidase